MSIKTIYTVCLLLGFTFTCCNTAFGKDKKDEIEPLTADGPYIIHGKDGSARIISVNVKGEIHDTTYARLPDGFTFTVTSYKGRHSFPVTLHKVSRSAWQWKQPRKLFVMSDPHGNLDCVISLLQGNGVIDKKYRWAYGANHLVVIGDVFDRGKNVTQILWLLYKLEQEAEEAGGHLEFLLGNHEPLVLMNDLRYTKKKYRQLADTLHVKYASLFSPDTELGRWLLTRNTMLIVGRNLFVHAGLSREFYDRNLDIPTVNEQMSRGLYKRRKEREETSPLVAFLYGGKGPIWYRGMVKQKPKYSPLAADTLQLLLDRYKADRVIVGHTVFRDISTFYRRRVIAVNVDNAENRKKRRGRAVLIEGNRLYVVGDKGKIKLYH